MISPWMGIFLVLLFLVGVLVCLKFISARCHLSPETSRKTVHIAMGLVTLFFPWIFKDSWPVLLLAGAAVATFAGTRLIGPLKAQFGEVLHGVDRHSLGEIYFPIAVMVVFLLSKSNGLLYIIPVLTLTLADAVAALVGVRYGQHRFATSEGTKSAEGSVAFFMVAFLSAHVPLLLMSNTGRTETLLIALVLGLLVMLFEAVSVGGLDNLFIPIGCYALLRSYMVLATDELLLRLAVLCLVALLVFFWRRRTTLIESGLLAAALAGYMNWALGGWRWLAVSLILFFTYTRLWPRSVGKILPVHTVRAVASVSVPGMVWMLLMLQNNRIGIFFEPFVLYYAAHSVIVGMNRFGHANPDQSQKKNLVHAVFRTCIVFLPAYFFPVINVGGGEPSSTALGIINGVFMALLAIPILFAVGLLHQLSIKFYGDSHTGFGRWIRRAIISSAALVAGWSILTASFTASLLGKILP